MPYAAGYHAGYPYAAGYHAPLAAGYHAPLAAGYPYAAGIHAGYPYGAYGHAVKAIAPVSTYAKTFNSVVHGPSYAAGYHAPLAVAYHPAISPLSAYGHSYYH